MKGIDDFEGERFHSARWRHGISLSGKCVGVIGDGCSAAQFIPIISNDPSTKVLNFCRTPNWFAPRFNNKSSSTQKKAFAYSPYLQAIYRAGMVSLLDARWVTWILSNKTLRGTKEAELRAYMKETAPAEYHECLIPDYHLSALGCKRIIMDPGYLQSLAQPNIDLRTSPIDSITEKGIRTKDGQEHELDVLILATGFDVDQQGPQAYLGTTVANYPNFFTLLGANVITGHTSAVASIECQVTYAVRMVGAMVKNSVDSFPLTQKAGTDYNDWLHKKLNKVVWQGGCTSYYRLDDGKIIATGPGTFAYFWWLTRTPNFSHYIQRGGSAKVATVAKAKRIARILALLAGLAILQYVGVSSLRNRIGSLIKWSSSQ